MQKKILIGNVKGPPGKEGPPGVQGPAGDAGALDGEDLVNIAVIVETKINDIPDLALIFENQLI